MLGAAEKFNLAAHLTEITRNGSERNAVVHACDIEDISGFHSSYSLNDRTRAFLKVQDGCDYNCSFCTIPLARGHSRSDTIDGVLRNMEELGKAGTKEIVLTGINLGDFGKGNEGGKLKEETFFDLVMAMDQMTGTGIERIRISSIEPNLLSNEVIEFVAGSNLFMPHFHIPLQSGSNKILGLMRRRYKRELYEDRVAQIKQLMPHCCIGVDVIVGFPTESDADFRETFDFLHRIDISYLHVFTYSERQNTQALELKPVVPMHTRNERNKMLRTLSYQKMSFFTEQNRGVRRTVLFEGHAKDGMMEGYTDNYIRIQSPLRAEWVNRVVEWEI